MQPLWKTAQRSLKTFKKNKQNDHRVQVLVIYPTFGYLSKGNKIRISKRQLYPIFAAVLGQGVGAPSCCWWMRGESGLHGKEIPLSVNRRKPRHWRPHGCTLGHCAQGSELEQTDRQTWYDPTSTSALKRPAYTNRVNGQLPGARGQGPGKR